jgi:pimeloyl-ACP methyl ester carboxylesterase
MHSDPPIAPPSAALLALEGRAWLELAALMPTMPLLRTALCGDGQPVLVLPGWLASDRSTQALRWFLRDRGYRAHGWGLGRNLGPTDEVRAGLATRLAGLRQRYGRTVSIVGWSLGGIYARELARRFPGDVRQVVTLASPFRDVSATSVARFRPAQPRPSADVIARLRSPVPVPSTSIYSRSDGVVAWQSCLDDEGPRRENVEVGSSHCGMGHHPGVLLVLADRLAQPEGAWRPFAPSGWSCWPFLAARVS